MAIPKSLQVDVTPLEKDLTTEALDRMLAVFYDACALRDMTAAFVKQVQEVYDAAVAVQKARSLYDGKGVQLDAIGRIVGQDRKSWLYSESMYMHYDTSGKSFDQIAWWVRGAALTDYVLSDDETYKTDLLSRIVKNHTLVASVPEITALISMLLGCDVSFHKVGPNTVELVVPISISFTQLWYLTDWMNNTSVDKTYRLPYPVTLSFRDVILVVPVQYFAFDTLKNRQFDAGRWACGTPPAVIPV